MTDYQNELVMEHLDLVNWVIRTRISVPNRPLLTYDDFYAIGCEAICRAALKYQADSGEFAPFACRYIYNAIIDHCRAMNYRLQRSVDAGFEEGEVLFDLLSHTTVDFEAEVTDDSANLRKSGDDAVLEAVRRERERIMLLGSDPACQASYIKKLFDNNVACFGASKENGGESFPDYVGALILGELDKCVALSAVYRKKEDEVAKERRTKAEAEERAFCEEQNRLSEQAVQEAIRTIKDGGVLQNQTVKFYRSRYRCNAFSIVNYLMRKYGVNVPLRTQGWINEKLTSVTIENGKCEHLRYMRAKGAQCSQRFFDCMSELIHNVCAETEG